MLQAWLQSLPELGIICWILYTNANPDGPALEISAPILFHALAAHLVQLWDRSVTFRRAVRVTGSSCWRHLVLVLAMKGGVAVSRPVFVENFSRVMRGDATFHFCGHEDGDDMNDDQVGGGVVGGWVAGGARAGGGGVFKGKVLLPGAAQVPNQGGGGGLKVRASRRLQHALGPAIGQMSITSCRGLALHVCVHTLHLAHPASSVMAWCRVEDEGAQGGGAHIAHSAWCRSGMRVMKAVASRVGRVR
jgi:hypothetical protein